MKKYQNYYIEMHRHARKFLDKLDIIDRTSIVLKIDEMTGEKNTALDIIKLQGFKNFY